MTVIVLSPGRGRDPMMKHSPQQRRAESTDNEPEGSSRWTPVRGGQPTSGEVGLPLEYVQFARSGRAGAPSTEKALRSRTSQVTLREPGVIDSIRFVV